MNCVWTVNLEDFRQEKLVGQSSFKISPGRKIAFILFLLCFFGIILFDVAPHFRTFSS